MYECVSMPISHQVPEKKLKLIQLFSFMSGLRSLQIYLKRYRDVPIRHKVTAFHLQALMMNASNAVSSFDAK